MKIEYENKKTALFAICCLVSLMALTVAAEPLKPVHLTCESLENPIGVDSIHPSLSWKLESDKRGEKQTAYRVLVASSIDKLDQDIGDLWDSGKVESDQSIHIAYAGKPLISKMTGYWKVITWGQDAQPGMWSPLSRWTMGLLKPSDWTAQWISASSAPRPPDPNDKLTIKKASYQTLNGKIAVDVTEIVRKELTKNGSFNVDFKTLGGDPAPNTVKELVVEFVRNGKPGIARASDFKLLSLSNTSDRPGKPAPLIRQEFDLAAIPDSAFVTVHSPGYFELYMNGTKVG